MKSTRLVSPYWNPVTETAELQRLQKLQLRRFREAMQFAGQHSPAYQSLYASAGIQPEDINTIQDIRLVPIVDKHFFQESATGSFYGNGLAVPASDVVFYHQTSGTTSRPMRQPDTLEDWYWWAECWAAVLWAQNVRKTDKVMIAFNYNLFIGFWGAHYGCEKIGAEIISAGGLSSEQKLHHIFDAGISTLISTPTYILRLAKTAAGLGIDLSQSPVKHIICAGEPGAQIPSTKKAIEKAWNCDVYNHVGATEVGAWGFECAHKGGGLHVNESMFLVEIVDIHTHEVIEEPDRYGKLVITAFHRKGQPCIRFNTNDWACWQETPCSCGRTYRMLKGGVEGRIDHLLKVKGTFVTPAVVEEIVNSSESLAHEYKVLIHPGDKRPELIAECVPETASEEIAEIAARIRKHIRNRTCLDFEVSIQPYGSLPKSELKANRFTDLRQKGGLVHEPSCGTAGSGENH
ncbi:phenylacetate--CoA ligase family protein [Paenibacillus sp. FSL H3-0333]|uniref:phenylacetate--CoA ligase family protein n=1 Tax=Paenibacillus sp. FSL H3-0333 TaxID=2921373 RepID=UPI0030F8D1B2